MKQSELGEKNEGDKKYWGRWYAALLIFLLLQILLYSWLTNWLQ